MGGLAFVLGFGWSYALGFVSARIYVTTVAWSLGELALAVAIGAWVCGRRASTA